MKSKINFDKLKFVFISVTFFYIVAHGYRLFNNIVTSDSLVSTFQDDIYWQRSLGRFLQPFVLVLRGTICPPWLIGCISIVFFSLSIFIITEIFNLDKKWCIVASSAILICNSTVTTFIACFIPWTDIYGMTLFLAVLGVYLYKKDSLLAYICGSISFVASMALYQAYIDVALGLLVMLLLRRFWSGDDVRKVFINALKYGAGLIATAVTYYVLYHLVCKIHHVTLANTYNGLSGVGEYSDVSLGELIAGVYKSFVGFLFKPGVFASTVLLNVKISSIWRYLVFIACCACIILIIVGIIIMNRKNNLKAVAYVLQATLLALFPFALNMVYFMSKGMEHDLMVYSFFMIFILMIVVINDCLDDTSFVRLRYLCLIPIVIMVWNNIVFSNQIYLKVDMENKAAISFATRLLNDIESQEDYEYGVTPVSFVGMTYLSDYFLYVPYLCEINVVGNTNSPFTYDRSLGIYLTNHLNANINEVLVDAVNNDEIKDMPDYPAKGSIKYVDDVLIVKISDY